MKNVITRSLSGLLLIIIVIGSVWMNSVTNYLLFLFILIFGLFEFYRFAKEANYYPNQKIGIATGIIIYSLSYLIASDFLSVSMFVLALPLVLFIPILELYRQNKNPIVNISITLFGLVYVVLPLSIIHFMTIGSQFSNNEPDLINSLNSGVQQVYYNSFIIIGYFIIQWVSDTGAFIFGVSFGKHKLFERISPKKSWEGAIGGFATTIGAAFLAHYIFPQLELTNWIIISLIITFFGIYGDLIESLYKRSVNVKDSGKIMPGHGGILDRFDSTLLALPMVFFYLKIINYL